MRSSPRFSLAAVIALAACGTPNADSASEEHEHPAGDAAEGVGRVAFVTSCAEQAQPTFERAVAMLHSFWFEEANEEFQEAATLDPQCAMAHWGRAMTLWGNPMTRAAPAESRAREALAAIADARALEEFVTERERMYIEAAAALYEDADEAGHIERMRAHEQAMRELTEAYPGDAEAVIFYGRIVVGNAPPDDLTFSRQLYAAELMEPLFADRPDHPGLAHYLIHAFDAPATAEAGLDAALRYADIAPDAPHALHMPTHIFTRLGHWDESIELNIRSAQAEPNPDAAVHPMDYMVYAYLQLGRDSDAGEVVGRAREIPDRFYGGLTGYNFAAMQARFVLERDRWGEAAELTVPGQAPPYVEAVTRFARGLGAARAGRSGPARAEIAELERLRDRLREDGDEYWATVVEAQRLAVAGWTARGDGDTAEAVRLATEAAELEGTVEKHPVTPGPLLPARELLGDLLLDLDRPAESLEAYEATLAKERGRARALFGAARAAERAGQDEAAERYYTELLELLAGADDDRPDLGAARAWLAAR